MENTINFEFHFMCFLISIIVVRGVAHRKSYYSYKLTTHHQLVPVKVILHEFHHSLTYLNNTISVMERLVNVIINIVLIHASSERDRTQSVRGSIKVA